MFSCADGRLEVSTASRSRTVGTARGEMFVAHREVIEHETFHADAGLVQHLDDVLLDHQLKV
jgi:hypothetical protein